MARLLLSCALVLGGLAGGCKRAAETVAAPATPVEEKVIGPSDARAAEVLREFAAVLEKALAAYNAGDQAALFAEFAATATPPPDDRVFTELFEGYYKAEFGRVTGLRLYPTETQPDPEFGMLVYLAQCERVKLAKVSANFVRENGTPKIVQLRFEKLETAAK